MSKRDKLRGYYLALPYTVEIVPDTEVGGYVACIKELPGCISSSRYLGCSISDDSGSERGLA